MSLNTILATAPLTTQNYHLKMIGSSIGNSLIWDNGTNVGIGNTNTSYTLDVSGTLRNTTSAYFATASGSVGIGTTSPSYTLDVYAASGYAARLNGPSYGGLILANAGTANTYMVGESTLLSIEHIAAINLRTNNADRVRITSAGNVGIGTTSDNYRLEVNANAATWATRIYNASATGSGLVVVTQNTTTSAGLALYNGTSYVLYARNDGNVGIGTSSPNIVGFTGTMLTINGTGNYQGFEVATSGVSRMVMISNGTDGYISTRQSGMGLIFETGAATERMRITSGGNVGIGNAGTAGVKLYTRSDDATSSTYALGCENGSVNLLLVRGDGVIFTGTAARSPYNDVSAAGANLIVVSGGNLQRSTSSLRFKTNVEDLYSDASSLIYKMRPIWYRSLGYTDRKDWSWYGFIAEEMAEIEPRLVQWGKDENDNDIADGIQYERISVLLVAEMQKMNKLIQEQQIQIQNLQEQINILQNK